jgi:hypothetical protein
MFTLLRCALQCRAKTDSGASEKPTQWGRQPGCGVVTGRKEDRVHIGAEREVCIFCEGGGWVGGRRNVAASRRYGRESFRLIAGREILGDSEAAAGDLYSECGGAYGGSVSEIAVSAGGPFVLARREVAGVLFDGERRAESVCGAIPWTGGKNAGVTGRGIRASMADGKELFYLSTDNKIMSAEMKAEGGTFQVIAVKPLF